MTVAKTSLQAVLLIAALGLPLGACSHNASIGAADADSSGDAGSPDASAGDGQSALSVPLRNIDVTVIYPLPSASALDASSGPVTSGGVALCQNLHMASYSGRQLSLSSRAVNETAAVLETINGPTP